MNTLDNEDKLSMEGILNKYECANALKQMNYSKSQGSDGITAEFYKLFWKDTKKHYISSINYSFESNKLTKLQ